MAIKSPDHWLEISSKKNEITEFNLVKGSERGVLKSLRSQKKKKKKQRKKKKGIKESWRNTLPVKEKLK